MALVKIEEFGGSLYGNVVSEALEHAQIIRILNIRKYAFSLVGIQERTPKGYIDDEPKSHAVRIDKVVFIGKKSDYKFVKGNTVNEDSEEYKETLDKCKEADLNFGVTLGHARTEYKKITADKDGCWYRHSLEVNIEKGNKEEQEYVEYMFTTIANMIMDNN